MLTVRLRLVFVSVVALADVSVCVPPFGILVCLFPASPGAFAPPLPSTLRTFLVLSRLRAFLFPSRGKRNIPSCAASAQNPPSSCFVRLVRLFSLRLVRCFLPPSRAFCAAFSLFFVRLVRYLRLPSCAVLLVRSVRAPFFCALCALYPSRFAPLSGRFATFVLRLARLSPCASCAFVPVNFERVFFLRDASDLVSGASCAFVPVNFERVFFSS